MACSDNVVRAGLTPKFKDVDTLVNILTYSMGGPSIDVGEPCGDPRILRYTPPTPEFEVVMLTCAPGEDLTFPVLKVPAVFVVIEGTGKDISQEGGEDILMIPGRSYYLPPKTTNFTLSVSSQQKGSLKIALAHENLHLEVPTSLPKQNSASMDEYETNRRERRSREDESDPYN